MSAGEKLHDLLTQVSEREATAIKVVADLHDSGLPGLVIERRKLRPEQPEEDPVRAESGPRAHCFQHSSSLVRYLQRYGTRESVVFVDPAGMTAHAILSEDSDCGKETLTMKPVQHPRWAPWRAMLGQVLGIREFVAFLRENRKAIIDPNPRELLLTLSQIRSSTTVELHVGEGAESMNGLMIKTKIQGDESRDIVDLPESITVQSPIFIGCAPRDIEIDLVLSASPDGTQIAARLSSADIRTAEIEEFEAMSDELHEKLAGDEVEEPDRMVVTLGTPREDEWSYLFSE